MRSIEVRFNHRSERPTFADAVYDEIADALVFEAERMTSSGSSPASRTSLMASKRMQRRSIEKIRARHKGRRGCA